MNSDNFILLNYNENFADNMSAYAYGKILEKNTNRLCCYENITEKRVLFEKEMSCFNLDYEYISSKRVEKIAKKSFLFSKKYIDEKSVNKQLRFQNNKKSDDILNLKHFSIDDVNYISDNIKNLFSYTNLDFIKNYDILENINTSNSIGLYINEIDYQKHLIDFGFIERATKRLNKYIKNPFIFVFSSLDLAHDLKSCINYEIYDLKNLREEFYFLTQCKHKIILNSENSYSEAFWASVLGIKDYSINIYDKTSNYKKHNKNWIGV